MAEPIQCVILAGGLGTRMHPVTETIPKALIPAAGIPFIDHQLRYLSRQGITQVVLSIGYRGEMIESYVGDGSRWHLDVAYVREGADLRGTGGALRLCADQGVLREKFFVLYGDAYLPIQFRPVWSIFGDFDEPALMTVFRNQGRWDRSNVRFTPGAAKVACYDKSASPELHKTMEYLDYGLSILRRDLVQERVPQGQKMDLAKLFHDLSVEGRLLGFEVQERFYEVGSPQGLKDFEDYLSNRSSSK